MRARANYNKVFEAVVEIDETYVGGKPRKPNVQQRGRLTRSSTREVEVHPRLLLLELRREAQARFTQLLLTTMMRESNSLASNFSMC